MRRILASLAMMSLAAGPAHAGLSVCNKTAQAARVALGRFDGAEWLSEGWWTVAPRQCASLVKEPLVARYYYLYASDGGAGSWTGGRAFCVNPDTKFQIVGRSACAARGYDSKSFFAVDTGSKPDFTQSLSD